MSVNMSGCVKQCVCVWGGGGRCVGVCVGVGSVVSFCRRPRSYTCVCVGVHFRSCLHVFMTTTQVKQFAM